MILSLDSQISIVAVGGRTCKISISRLSTPKEHPDYFNKFRPKDYLGTHKEYFVFSVGLEYSADEAMSYYSDMEIEEDNACYLYERQVESHLLKSVTDIGLAANIAKPGSFNAPEFYTFVDSELKSYLSEKNSSYYLTHRGVGFEELHEIAPIDECDRWPPVRELATIQVYNWLRGIGGFEYGAAETDLGTAYAAFSYLMGDLGENSKGSLVWALMGLEALYCEGNTGLRQQLVAKTEVVLGERKKYKKKFGSMYDYRSRLIHGDIHIVYRHHIYDASKEQEKFDGEFYEAEKTAISVLISTFQTMCLNGMYELRFSYGLNQS